MSRPRVRNTLLLACITVTAVSFPSHAEEPDIEVVRFRPFSRFLRNKSDEQDKDKGDSAPGLEEPVKAPPTAKRRTAPQTSERSGDDPLLLLTERAIEKTSHRYLDANQHRPWQITHGLVALRKDFVLRDGNRTVNAIEWISDGAQFRGQYWFEATEYGARAHPYNGVPYEFEGHVNQTLGLLALSNLPLSHEFRVQDGKTVTMADMVRHAQMTASTRGEITWTLWFLTHYLDIDTEWVNADDEPWSLEELVRLQTKGKVVGAPCGGTHGLFALAYARNAYLYKHGELRGVWFEADQKVKRHIELARSLQNYDGSFSTEYFKGPSHSRDFNERIKASGHMLEWLMMSLPHQRLSEAWVRRAVAAIATDMVHNASRPAECGPLYHALHSLILYRDRMSLPQPATPETLAEQPPQPDSSASPSTRTAEANGNQAAGRPEAETETAPAQQSPSLEPVRIAVDPDETRLTR